VVPVDTEFGRKTTIHQGSCNQDYSCLKGNCPSFVVVSPKKGRYVPPSRPLPVELTEPTFGHPEGEVLIHMPGIGGTGVVTVSRVMQMAALLDGRYAGGVDQTGLSQKGGPVISDVRISARPIEGAVAATEHTADLLLGFDLLGAASPRSLAVADPERTVAVVNTARVATAAMVTDTRVEFPTLGSVEARIDQVTRSQFNAYVNAEWIAERLFGDHLATNIVLLGSAYQLGCIPITGDAIEQAIQLNGTAAETNVTAFRWGRAAVIDSEAVLQALSPPSDSSSDPPASYAADTMLTGTSIPDALRQVLRPRVADLVGYQSTAYARRYVDDVLAVADVESEKAATADFPITRSYARGLHKLMAYKDEYEVARLHLDPVERAKLAGEFGPKARPRVMLQPPVLKVLGLRRKIHLGPAADPAFHVLRAMRHLRGTPFDLFGYARKRRTERLLIVEYRGLMGAALDRLCAETAESVRQVAELPELIRGYDDVKEANIEKFRRKARVLVDLLEEVRPGRDPSAVSKPPLSDVS
jgi:indolepyruvate ferredoxin oxidoreductase